MKWEYLRIKIVDSDHLATQGMQGWELVAVTAEQVYIFKRPVK